MPQLDKVQHEIFCRAVSLGMSQADAYVEAGYERSSGNASVLASKPDVKARIDELITERFIREGKAVDHNLSSEKAAFAEIETTGTLTKEWVLKQLVENTRLAREAGQYAASNKAIEMIGRELGMFQERKPEEDTSKKLASEAAEKALPLDTVNKILENLGFQGQVDLTSQRAMEAVEKRGRGKPPKKAGETAS